MIRARVGLAPLFACCALAAPLLATPAPDPHVLQDLRWRLVGPFRAGRVLTVAGVPGDPARFLFGAVNGGVWETRDAGRTWSPIFDGQPIGSIGALAVAPSQPAVIYVGTGEADMRSDIAQGDGMYKSTDGGSTWTRIGLADSRQIGRILVDPGDPARVLVAALGPPYAPNPERGVFLSEDGGAHWTKTLGQDDDTGAIDLAFEPGNARVVYAALWQTRRPPWSVYAPSSGPKSGVYKSTDAGRTWTSLEGRGLPAGHGRVGFGLAPSQPRRVYAIVDHPDHGGLYRSDDAGATWTRTSEDRRLWGRGWYFGGVTVEPREADVVWVGNTALYRSDDAGRTFVPVKGAPGGDDYHELWIDPGEPKRRILGTDQGAVVSLDGGASWSSWYNQPTAQIYRMATDQAFPYRLYGSQQDSGALSLPSRTPNREGITMMDLVRLNPGGENDTVAPDPRRPGRVFGGRVEWLDEATGQTHAVPPTLSRPEIDRSTWTLPLVFSRRDPRVLYFSHQRLLRTADDGRTWTVISPDLTREDPGVPANLDPITAADAPRLGRRHGVIYAIAPSRLLDADLWAGTDDGLVWRTRDEGAHWAEITPKALTPWSKVAMIEVSHFEAEAAYLAVDRHRLGDDRPYVYRTRDAGGSWAMVAEGIPPGSFVNVVREDPVRRGLLYAGTEKGVYVSLDDGDHWHPLQLNLPVTSVRDIDVHGEGVAIATHGRGFWILDDVTPLRQLTAEAQQARAWLFAPAEAVRARPGGFLGTPLPKDEPVAPNPPAGAVIDYVLGAPAQAVTLAIRDDGGGVVRQFASSDPAAPLRLDKLRVAPGWVAPAARVSTARGHHRLVWSLRHAPPAPLAEWDNSTDGAWVPPGVYAIELTVDGASLRQPLTVKPDPRVTLSREAYARQYALARRIEELRAKVEDATDIGDRLVATLKKGGTPDLLRDVQAILGPAWGGTPVAPPPEGLTMLRAIGERLSRLASAVDEADVDPGPEAVAGFEAVQPEAAATLAAWEALRAKAPKP